jgi:hypothetical protein
MVHMELKDYLKEHQRLGDVLKSGSAAERAKELARQKAEVERTLRQPEGCRHCIERPMGMGHHREGAPLNHMKY